MHMGPDFILVNISVKFADDSSASDIERSIARLDSMIRTSFPTVKRVFIEAETLSERSSVK